MSTLFSESAHAASYTDPTAHADLILDLAVKDAITQIRDGRPGFAEYRLTRAATAAARLIDGTTVWRCAWPGGFTDHPTEHAANSDRALRTTSVNTQVVVYPIRHHEGTGEPS